MFSNMPRVTADRNALKAIVEIAVVANRADRDAADDRGGQLGRIATPLLGRVAAHENLVQLLAHLRDDPIAQAAWVGVRHPCCAQPALGLERRAHAPHLFQRCQVERKGKLASPVMDPATMAIVVEPRKAIHESPHALIVGVKNMRAVAVHLDAGNRLGIAIARDVWPLVDDQQAAAPFGGRAREYGTEHPATDHQVVVRRHPNRFRVSKCRQRTAERPKMRPYSEFSPQTHQDQLVRIWRPSRILGTL